MAMHAKRKSGHRRSSPSTGRCEALNGTGQFSIDFAELDVVVVDEVRREQHRPLLVVATDVATRRIVRCELQMTRGLPPYLEEAAPRRG